MTYRRNSVCLVKGGHRYLFRYHPGQEPHLFSTLVELADDPRWDLTWVDAAILSYQIDVHGDCQPSACTVPRDRAGWGA
jgi:hypothetical protein